MNAVLAVKALSWVVVAVTIKGWALVSGSSQARCRHTTGRSDKGMSNGGEVVSDKRKARSG